MTSKDAMYKLAMFVKEKRGVLPVKDILRRHLKVGNPFLSDVPPELYDAVILDLQGAIGNKVMGYAHNSTIAPLPTPERKTQMPPQMRAPYGGVPEVDTTAQQVESLTMKALQVNRTIETREDAIAAVKELQEKWDLVDDNAVLKQLMEKMEERHGEEFNAFFEATIRQVMVGTGLSQVKIDTSAVLLTLAQAAPVRVREEPGFLVYELVEDVDA